MRFLSLSWNAEPGVCLTILHVFWTWRKHFTVSLRMFCGRCFGSMGYTRRGEKLVWERLSVLLGWLKESAEKTGASLLGLLPPQP